MEPDNSNKGSTEQAGKPEKRNACNTTMGLSIKTDNLTDILLKQLPSSWLPKASNQSLQAKLHLIAMRLKAELLLELEMD
jgi:hypothetical protein